MYSTDKHGIKLQGNLVESRESIGHGVLPIQIDKVQDGTLNNDYELKA